MRVAAQPAKCSAVRRDLGWAPAYGLHAMVADMLQQLQAQQHPQRAAAAADADAAGSAAAPAAVSKAAP